MEASPWENAIREAFLSLQQQSFVIYIRNFSLPPPVLSDKKLFENLIQDY